MNLREIYITKCVNDIYPIINEQAKALKNNKLSSEDDRSES